MTKELNKLSVSVYGHEFEVHVPKEKEQLYLSAAEYVNKRLIPTWMLMSVYRFRRKVHKKFCLWQCWISLLAQLNANKVMKIVLFLAR